MRATAAWTCWPSSRIRFRRPGSGAHSRPRPCSTNSRCSRTWTSPAACIARRVACGLNPVALSRLIGYDDAQTVASAALKLLPLDPADVASWVLDAFPAIDRLAAEVASLIDPAAIPAAGAPQIEAWAEAHAVAQRRLFNA